MSLRKLLVMLCVGVFLAAAGPLSAKAEEAAPVTGVTCQMPKSDVDSLHILSNYYPNAYWWDHTDLTITLLADPAAEQVYIDAIEGAIGTWTSVLQECFGDQITLTYLPDAQPSKTDIVVRYAPIAHTFEFGRTHCAGGRCPNVVVRSHYPYDNGYESLPPFIVENIALHEIGHAFGLGHPTGITPNDPPSFDLMGGGPAVTQCDIDAIAFVFAWAFEGRAPSRPELGPYVC